MKRVLVPLAEGFEELEAVTIIDVLRRAGLEVVVASLGSSPVTGSHGIRIAADTPLAALAEQEFDMIALPGGMPGADHLKKDPRITEIVQRLHGKGRPVAAICAAPMVLASAGILDGRRATSYPGFLKDAAKTTVVGDAVVVDRGVITSRGPGTALDFALDAGGNTRRTGLAPVHRIAPRARKGRHRVTEAVDKSRPEIVREDEHASIVQSLARVDWLVLFVVALYALMLRAPEESSRLLYAAIAVYTLFVVAFRWRGFPVRETGSRIALGAAAMVTFITFVAMRTGGSESPMVNLYLLPIVVVAMTLGRRGAIVVFAGVMLAWLSLAAGEGLRLPAGELLTRLFGELGPFALVAYVTQALADTILTARQRIEEMAERDSLTGMLNLRTFKTMLGREHGLRSRGGRGGYAILLVDMDDLKAINDEHGHQAGNRAITAVASAIQRAIRSSDMAARYGGDEFVIFLPEAAPEIAETVAQRVRNHVYRSLFPVGERLQRMTVSVGTASYPRDGGQAEDIVSAAAVRTKRDRELRQAGEGRETDGGTS